MCQPLPRIIISSPSSDNFGCILTVFNRQETRTVTRSLGTRILRFSRETKLTETVQKLNKNSQSDEKLVAVAPSLPP